MRGDHSYEKGRQTGGDVAFPACAGIIPGARRHSARLRSTSPHARGSSAYASQLGTEVAGFPAYAGIIPGRPIDSQVNIGLPRVRGDHPSSMAQIDATARVSRMRGDRPGREAVR